MGNYIIIDNTANHRNHYIDASGDERNDDNIHEADFFTSADGAQQWLDTWSAENDGKPTDWAQIVEASEHGLIPTMSVRVVTAYRVDGIHDDEFSYDVIYMGCNKETADHVRNTARRTYKKGARMTKFNFELLPTESMPDGHNEWMR